MLRKQAHGVGGREREFWDGHSLGLGRHVGFCSQVLFSLLPPFLWRLELLGCSLASAPLEPVYVFALHCIGADVGGDSFINFTESKFVAPYCHGAGSGELPADRALLTSQTS